MFGPSRSEVARQLWRKRPDLTRRVVAIVAALVLELLLGLLLLSLGLRDSPLEKSPPLTVVEFGETSSDSEEPTPPEESPQQAAGTPQNALPRRIDPPLAAMPVTVLPDPPELASFDLSKIRSPMPPPAPAATSGPPVGPPNRAAIGDTARVGTAPNGEPLYAAAWYRKPYDDELTGYLSTATGPGWGLIACRTVPDFKVEDCVAIDEYPKGSNINRSILAAAWQFKVRPPRLGGRPLVGAWVRIRFDYTELP